MKKTIYVFSSVILAGFLASCGGGLSSSASSATSSESPVISSISSISSIAPKATLKIADNVGSVVIGKTLQLSASYSDATNDPIAWKVDDTAFGTIDAGGLLTGIKDGDVTVTAYSSVDSTISDSLTVVVLGYSLSITTEASKVWMDETLKLASSYSLEQISDPVSWSVDDDTVASISETGLLTPLKTGRVKVIAKNSTNDRIFDEKEITIADTIIDSSKNTAQWNYDGLKSDNPSLVKATESDGGSFAYYKGILETKYMMSLKADLSNPDGNDTWSRISLGHSYTNEESQEVFHGTMVSPGPGFSQRKLVTGTLIAGSMQWGIETDRSQLWNVHDQANLDYANLTLTSVRDGNDYYYFVNGELYYKEVNYLRFDGIRTIPTINVRGVDAAITDMSVSTDETTINDFLSTTPAKKAFYPTYASNVTVSDDNVITFSNAPSDQQAWPYNNVKDNAAKSIGNAVTLPANKATKMELDVSFTSWGNDENVAALCVSMKRYDNNASQTRSFLVGKNNYGFTGWDSNNNLPDGIGAKNSLTTALELNTSYHVVMNRLMSETSQDCSMAINGDSAAWGWTTESDSTGNVVIAIGSRSANMVVSNFTITVL